MCEALAKSTRSRKEIKGVQIRKEDVDITLFAYYMILYVKYLNNHQKTPTTDKYIQ